MLLSAELAVHHALEERNPSLAITYPLFAAFQVSIEKVQHRLIERFAQLTRYPMCFLWIDLHKELLVGVFQRAGHLHRVLEQHIIIFEVVQDQ